MAGAADVQGDGGGAPEGLEGRHGHTGGPDIDGACDAREPLAPPPPTHIGGVERSGPLGRRGGVGAVVSMKESVPRPVTHLWIYASNPNRFIAIGESGNEPSPPGRIMFDIMYGRYSFVGKKAEASKQPGLHCGGLRAHPDPKGV